MRPSLRTAICACLAFALHAAALSAQTGVIEGRAVDATTRAPLATVQVTARALDGRTATAVTDAAGRFLIAGLEPGLYAVTGSSLGFAEELVPEVAVQSSRPTFVLLEMRRRAIELEGLTVSAGGAFAAPESAPVSVSRLSPEEVRRTPGGQLDISRTLLSLPGVIGGVDNRNDLLVRGGGPGENAYFLDGIRIPQINHFATQGTAGGAVGLLNVDFIRETEFYTGAFPARFGGALSSVLLVENRPGSSDGIAGDFTLGASEAALTLDGPAGEQGSWLFSVRRSYLQFLFEALGLPIRPDYWDAQTRVELFPSERDRVVLVGIGSIDEFDLVAPEAGDVENQEIFDRVLDNDQRSYTVGGSWERQIDGGVARAVVSRSWVDYEFGDIDANDVPLLENRSIETRSEFRLEADLRLGDAFDLEVGGIASRESIDLDLFQIATAGTAFETDVDTDAVTRTWRTGGFVQGVYRTRSERLTLTGGARADDDSALEDGFAVSPRLGASLRLSPTLTASAGTGVFHQSPTLVSLGVREDGAPVNRGLKQIRNVQGVLGLTWQPSASLQFRSEGFWKSYDNYPVSRDDPRVSLANLGDDYGFVGAEPLVPEGEGRAYGVELSAQKKLTSTYYLLGAYTWSSSEFSGADGELRPSSWDVRHSLDLTAGYRPSRRWEFGAKLRVLSGRPFTPFDVAASIGEFARTGRGVPDLDRISAERVPTYARFDLRAERTFDLGRWNGRVYLDIQNVLARENVIGFNFSQDPALAGGLRPIDGTGLLPFFGFSVEF
jgi:hypothetical protein